MRYLPHVSLIFLATLALFSYSLDRKNFYEKISTDSKLAQRESLQRAEAVSLKEYKFINFINKKYSFAFSDDYELDYFLSHKYDLSHGEIMEVKDKLRNIHDDARQARFLFHYLTKKNIAENGLSFSDLEKDLDLSHIQVFELDEHLDTGADVYMLGLRDTCNNFSEHCLLVNDELASFHQLEGLKIEPNYEYLVDAEIKDNKLLVSRTLSRMKISPHFDK